MSIRRFVEAELTGSGGRACRVTRLIEHLSLTTMYSTMDVFSVWRKIRSVPTLRTSDVLRDAARFGYHPVSYAQAIFTQLKSTPKEGDDE